MPAQGYVRFPTLYQSSIVLVSEDDLWLVSSSGGRAERLTAGVGRASYPRLSPDGQCLAFVGREEGPGEIYMMPALGGPAQRLTFQGDSSCRVLGWSPQGDAILYTSSAGQFDTDYKVIYAISLKGGLPRQLPFGIANAISYGPCGGIVLGRNIEEPAYWKRYRGGRVGHLWCDNDGSGTFQRLLDLAGNLADPCWVGDRIYFISDHEGVGSITRSGTIFMFVTFQPMGNGWFSRRQRTSICSIHRRMRCDRLMSVFPVSERSSIVSLWRQKPTSTRLLSIPRVWASRSQQEAKLSQ